DFGRSGQVGANHVMAALAVTTEVMERVGVSPLDDGVGLGGKVAHVPPPLLRTRSAPPSATRNQSGRCASSYSISYSAFSSRKNRNTFSAATESAGQRRG